MNEIAFEQSQLDLSSDSINELSELKVVQLPSKGQSVTHRGEQPKSLQSRENLNKCQSTSSIWME